MYQTKEKNFELNSLNDCYLTKRKCENSFQVFVLFRDIEEDRKEIGFDFAARFSFFICLFFRRHKIETFFFYLFQF